MHDEHGERAVAFGGSMAGPGDAFHVVIPSTPGYGFSGPARQLGRDTKRVVQAWTELTRSLGYTRYIAQSGDWGLPISLRLGLEMADRDGEMERAAIRSASARTWPAAERAMAAEDPGWRGVLPSERGAADPQAGREDLARADPVDRIRPGRPRGRHGAAKALRRRRANVRPHLALATGPVQLPVAVTRGTR